MEGGKRPIHWAFSAPTEEAVDEFYRIGLQHGGRDNGASEDCGSGYYGAFFIDPDGDNTETGFRKSRTGRQSKRPQPAVAHLNVA